MNRSKLLYLVITGILLGFSSFACIWDGETLEVEVKRSPKIADIIIGIEPQTNDVARLEAKIADLTLHRRDEDPSWWNDLAGAYLRLGKPEEAVKLLEPVVAKFDGNYGIHANLGTAYHLLGRYKDAEREIARDLEINPDAHFGLERYHLALLQYLNSDREYQKNHLYLDVWTEMFMKEPAEHFYDHSRMEADRAAELKREAGEWTRPLAGNWNLGTDPKWADGVIYMATLNPKEPACFTMLGIVCLTKRDFNLAAAAFEKAIALGSPQTELLQQKIGQARKFVSNSQSHSRGSATAQIAGASVMRLTLLFLVPLGLLMAAIIFFRLLRDWKG